MHAEQELTRLCSETGILEEGSPCESDKGVWGSAATRVKRHQDERSFHSPDDI